MENIEENIDEINMVVTKALVQRPISYKPMYRHLMGSTAGGVILSQLMHWLSDANKIICTDQDILDETEVTPQELKLAKEKFKTFSFLKITREGLPAKTCYAVDYSLLETAVYLSQKSIS